MRCRVKLQLAAHQPDALPGGLDEEAACTDRCSARAPPTEAGPNGDGTMTQRQRYRADSGEVFTKDELLQQLTAKLEAINPETRAANCDGTIDDLITDYMRVGIHKRVDAEDDE